MNLPEPDFQRWHTLGRLPPATLIDARNQLHWAVQTVASIGYTFVEPTPDWSHTSLTWLDDSASRPGHELGMLASPWAPGLTRFRAALRLTDLTLLLLDEEGDLHSECNLAERTLDDGYIWLTSAITSLMLTAKPSTLVRPNHELPAHPTGGGAVFSYDPPEAFAELARWYANAYRVLQALSASSPHASPVQCWPHHFDIAVLFSFDEAENAEAGRSIGVGLVPGDGSYAEPYWYIAPWPFPDDPTLPPLAGEGRWHTEGWHGAVLTATRIVEAGEAEAQAARVTAFIRSGLDAAHTLLELSP